MSDGISQSSLSPLIHPKPQGEVQSAANMLTKYLLVLVAGHPKGFTFTYGYFMNHYCWDHRFLHRVMDAISERDAENGTPLLTSVIVSASNRKPSKGYWNTVELLRKDAPVASERNSWWLYECGAVYGFALGLQHHSLPKC